MVLKVHRVLQQKWAMEMVRHWKVGQLWKSSQEKVILERLRATILRQSGIRCLVALLTPSIMEQKSSTTFGDGSVWSLHDLSLPYNGILSFFMEITCCCDLMFLLQNFMPMIALSNQVIGKLCMLCGCCWKVIEAWHKVYYTRLFMRMVMKKSWSGKSLSPFSCLQMSLFQLILKRSL